MLRIIKRVVINIVILNWTQSSQPTIIYISITVHNVTLNHLAKQPKQEAKDLIYILFKFAIYSQNFTQLWLKW